MKQERFAGVLLHPTSLPGNFGIGDLGKQAYNFVDFLESGKFSIWQVFPLGPTGYGDSPYQCFSAFAGNPLLISPELLAEEGLLDSAKFENYPLFDPKKIDYGQVIGLKNELLRTAFRSFVEVGGLNSDAFKSFTSYNSEWLEDYSLFMAVKNHYGGQPWTTWDKGISRYELAARNEWKAKLYDEVNFIQFCQYKFDQQWSDIKDYCHSKGIKIVGDLPIFVAYDSSDVWSNRELFSVDDDGKLISVAGVPPDYFSATGQLWGNPLYKWNVMEERNFDWWITRFRKLFSLTDIVRIDHFRGFDAYWEIPGDAETAINGRWVKAPGKKLFQTVRNVLGTVPIIAEDLGVITKEVAALRDEYEFPGIKILQFAFGETGEKKFLPHNHIKNCVVHTGSHDNDTTRGFFEAEKKAGSGIYEWTQKYLDYYNDNVTSELIRVAYASVANYVVIPMQDILDLGSESRMNYPGRPSGNWTWRFTWNQINHDISGKYSELAELYERIPITKNEFEEIETENK